MPSLTNSKECEQYLRDIWNKNTLRTQESVYAVYLNHKGERIFHDLITIGSYSKHEFALRATTQNAWNVHSDYIVIAHNHPCGDPNPSKGDIETTKKICLALSLYDIKLIDHIILTHDNYFSFKDAGMLADISYTNFLKTG